MNLGKLLTDREITDLYLKYPKMFVENPTVVFKNFKNSKLMFIVIDGKRYIIEENKTTKETRWFDTDGTRKNM